MGSLGQLPPVLRVVEFKVVLPAKLLVELLDGDQLLQLRVEADLPSVTFRESS